MNVPVSYVLGFFFSSRRRHTRLTCDWSSDVCSSDLGCRGFAGRARIAEPRQPAGEQARFLFLAASQAHAELDRSEERRVGKEGGWRGSPADSKKKARKMRTSDGRNS